MNRFEVVEGGIAPERAYNRDAGLDIALRESIVLRPGETAYVPSGLRLFLEPGYFANVMTRSSTFKHGVMVIPTVIDAGYTGEISTIVTNASNETVTLERGRRLAQVVLQKYYHFDNENFDVNASERGDRKTGSSGE